MSGNSKNKKMSKSLILTFILIPVVTLIVVFMFFLHKKSVLIENNFNSYLNKGIMPISINLSREQNKTVPQLGIIAKKKISCYSSIAFDMNVKTNCTFEDGSLSILNYQNRKNTYIPIFKFKNLNGTIYTPVFSMDVFKKFHILLSVTGVNFNNKILDFYLTKDAENINNLLLNDKNDISDYNNSKEELYSIFKDLTFKFDIVGEYKNKKRFDVHYLMDIYNEDLIHYKNKSSFSIVFQKPENVSLEISEGNRKQFNGLKEGSFKSSTIDFLSYYDLSYLALKDSELIKKLIYDFYKINYYSSENKIIFNQYYLDKTNDIMFSKEEVLSSIEPLLERLYERVKGNPIGISTKVMIEAIGDDKAGIFIYKRLKKGAKPLSVITEGVRTTFNYDKYYKEIQNRYSLEEISCSSISDCENIFKEKK